VLIKKAMLCSRRHVPIRDGSRDVSVPWTGWKVLPFLMGFLRWLTGVVSWLGAWGWRAEDLVQESAWEHLPAESDRDS